MRRKNNTYMTEKLTSVMTSLPCSVIKIRQKRNNLKKRIHQPTYPPESFRECGECGEGEGERRGDYFFEDR
jgi:hypothetical protein